MNSTNRLVEIKTQLSRWQDEEKENTFVEFWPLDMRRVEWLIEQTERVKDLETINRELHDRRSALRKQNKHYLEELGILNDVINSAENADELNAEFERLRALESESNV